MKIQDQKAEQAITILAPAKVNLSLRLGPKGPSGLHQIFSYMQTISLCDEVSIRVLASQPGKQTARIQVTCSDPSLPTDQDNLLYRALDLWLAKTGLSPYLQAHLKKNIPSQAGLGGGSSDAAAGLLALQELFPQARLEAGDLQDLAFSLGSDVPFFLTQGLAQVSGYGDQVTPLPDLAKSYFILAKPKLDISTRQAFQAWDAAHPQPSDLRTEQKMWAVTAPYINDFQDLQASRYPIIRDLIDFLETSPARQVALSGSGPSVFASYGHMLEQKIWYKRLKEKFPSCQVWAVESLARPR